LIDWWLFFSANVLVLTMVFHTYVAYLCRKARMDEEEKNQKKEQGLYGELK